jgi:hypothetical protein
MRVYIPTERPSLPVSNLISKKLEVNGFKPILGDVSPFLSGLPKGAGVYIPRPLFGDANQLNVLTGLPRLDKLVSLSTTQRQPLALNPLTPPVPQKAASTPGAEALSWVPTLPASALPTKPPVPVKGFTPPSWSAKKGWKSAAFGRSVATKGVGVMLLTQGTTQAQIADPLIHVGVPAQTANGMANAALTFMHSHGFGALAVAFSVAGE